MANQEGKGPKLEYNVSRLFQNQGYLTRRSIPLHYGSNNQDATDIDIFGIMFTPPFQIHKIICDCKNKQKSKPYERIFWAKGLGQFVGANDIYVSLPQVSWDTVKFAQKGDVRILTADEIQEYFSRNNSIYGIADDKFYVNFFNSINNDIKANKDFAVHYSTLKKLYLNEDPYVTVNIAIELLLKAGSQLEFVEEKGVGKGYQFWRFMCCESLVLISLSLLNICSDTISLPSKAREKHILTKLTYGDIDPSKINTILSYAKNVANEMVKASIPKTALPKKSVVDFGEISPPEYASSIIGLVERAIQNQDWYINLPQVLDFILFEYVIKNKEFSIDEFQSIFKTNLTEEKLKAAKNLFVFARSICKVNLNFLWDFAENFMMRKSEELNLRINVGTSEFYKENVNTNEHIQTSIDELIKE